MCQSLCRAHVTDGAAVHMLAAEASGVPLGRGLEEAGLSCGRTDAAVPSEYNVTSAVTVEAHLQLYAEVKKA